MAKMNKNKVFKKLSYTDIVLDNLYISPAMNIIFDKNFEKVGRYSIEPKEKTFLFV